MSLYNELAVDLTCPRCHREAGMLAELRFGYLHLDRYRLGDRLRWHDGGGDGLRSPATRPEGGNYEHEAYVECPLCRRDFWLRVTVEGDVLREALVDVARPGYIPDGTPDGSSER